jgi:hypothetical protein
MIQLHLLVAGPQKSPMSVSFGPQLDPHFWQAFNFIAHPNIPIRFSYISSAIVDCLTVQGACDFPACWYCRVNAEKIPFPKHK